MNHINAPEVTAYYRAPKRRSLGDGVQTAILDNELLAETSTVLASRHNGHLPVHRLPNELISIIFVLAESSSYGPGGPAISEVPLSVSKVCKRWREVALMTPRLWTQINRESLSLTNIFLARSGNAPLRMSVVVGWGSSLVCAERLACLSRHIDRWASLKLVCFGGAERRNAVIQWMRCAAPSLEALCILQVSPPGDADAVVELEDLFEGKTARLRDINLSGFHIPLTHPIFSGLTILHLSRVWYFQENAITHMLQAIEASPALEELFLGRIYFCVRVPDASSSFIEATTPYPNLTRLKSLSLRYMETWTIQYFLAHITIPSQSELDLELKDPRPDEDLTHTFPPNPTTLFNLPTIRSLELCIGESDAKCTVRGRDSGGAQKLLIVVSGSRGNRPVRRVVSSLGPALSTIPLERFEIHGYSCPKWSAAALVRTIDCFPSIDTLLFHACHPRFVRALTAFSHNYPCPGFKRLLVSHCAISSIALISIVQSRVVRREDTALLVKSLDYLGLYGLYNLSTAMDVSAALPACVGVGWGEDCLGPSSECE